MCVPYLKATLLTLPGTYPPFSCIQLLGRMGTLEESGELCLYLAAEATFTTGVDHILSGGAELNYGKKAEAVGDLPM